MKYHAGRRLPGSDR